MRVANLSRSFIHIPALGLLSVKSRNVFTFISPHLFHLGPAGALRRRWNTKTRFLKCCRVFQQRQRRYMHCLRDRRNTPGRTELKNAERKMERLSDLLPFPLTRGGCKEEKKERRRKRILKYRSCLCRIFIIGSCLCYPLIFARGKKKTGRKRSEEERERNERAMQPLAEKCDYNRALFPAIRMYVRMPPIPSPVLLPPHSRPPPFSFCSLFKRIGNR